MKKRSSSRDAFFNLRVVFGITLSSVGVFLALLALSINSSSTAAAASKVNNGVKIAYPVHADISKPVRDMAPWPEQRVEEHEAAENPKIRTGLHKDAPDTVVQKQSLLGLLAPNIPAPILNFAGIPFPGVICNCAPPDTNGEVGATQYVQMVNEGYQVFDKTTGASVFGPASINSIWTGFPGVCTAGQGDPVVVYDQFANRWIISQFAGGLTHECVAVSTTSDATGSYARYDFNISAAAGAGLYDYPHLSVWPDAYYMSMNVFNTAGTAYLGPQGYAFNRIKMIAGDPSAELIVAPRLSSSFPPLLPADVDGSTLPPAGAPNPYVLLPDSGTYRVYQFHVDFVTPANSTFTQQPSPPAAAGYTEICPFTRSCVPELSQSSGNWLDAIGDRPMFRLAYRNFGDHESLVGNFTVSSGGVSAPRWFELRNVTATNGSGATLFQEGTYQPDTTWRFQGSVAMDQQGNMALGYSASSAAIFPQVRYTGRLAGDPLGMMPQGEATLHAGTGAQTATSNRWGDYSDMTIDPVDDCTFWYTTEYYDSTSSFNWRTRIGNFKFDSCGGSGGDANLVGAASRVTQGSAGSFDVDMPLAGGGDDPRSTGGSYTAVFTFDTAVTSGSVSVMSGTATVGAVTFSGNEMRAALTGVADVQNVVLHTSGVNGGGSSNDVSFGYLIGDANGNAVVDKPDKNAVKAGQGPVTGANFRDDLNADGVVNRPDGDLVKANKGHHL